MSKAEKRKGFVLYFDQIEQVGLLSDEEAGQLFKALFSCNSDKNPPTSFKNPLIQMCFSVIYAQMRRDAEKYEQKCERMAENARRKWEEQEAALDFDDADAIASNTNANTKKEKNKKIKTVVGKDGVTESEKDSKTVQGCDFDPEIGIDGVREIDRVMEKGVPPTYVAVRQERALEYARTHEKYLGDVLLEWWIKDKQTATWQRESQRLDRLHKSLIDDANKRRADAEMEDWIAYSNLRYLQNNE